MNDMELSLDLITEYYLEELDNVEMEYTEKVNPLAPLDKIMQIFYAYIKQIKQIRKERKDLDYLKTAMKKCEYLYKNTPELKDKRFIFVHLFPIPDIENNEIMQTRFAVNMATAIIHHDEEGIMDILEQYCMHGSKKSEKFMRKLTLKEAAFAINSCINFLETDLDNNVKLIKNVRKMIEKSKYYNSVTFVDSFKFLIKNFMKNINTRYNIIKYNANDYLFSINDGIKKNLNMYSKNTIKKISADSVTDKEIIDKSKLIMKIRWTNNLVFYVYKTIYPGVSAMNCGGVDIIVSNDFFKFSKEVQNAILYHEMGHYFYGHFSQHVEFFDDRELVKMIYQLRKELKNYCKKHKCGCTDDKTLVSLLIELDADRNVVDSMGKRLAKKGVTKSLQNYEDHFNLTDDLRFSMDTYNDLRKKMISKMGKDKRLNF